MNKLRFIGAAALIAGLLSMLVLGCSNAPQTPPTQAPAPQTSAPQSSAPSAKPTPTQTQAPASVRLMYGSGSTSSPMYVINVGIAKAIAKYAPNIEVTLVATSGGADSWNRVSQGQVQLGLVSAIDWYEIYNGVGAQQGKRNENVRGLWVALPTPYHYVVRANSNIKTLQDLVGKKINPGPKGNLAEIQNIAILNTLGITDKNSQFFSANYAEAIDAFQNGQIDSFMGVGAVPDPAINQLALTVPLRFLGFTQDDWQKASKVAPGNSTVQIPGGLYPGINQPVLTTGLVSGAATTKDLISNDVAYQLIKAFCTGYDELIRPLHKALASVGSPEDFLINTAKSPLHAGVIKYLREKGKTIPDQLIPPEAK